MSNYEIKINAINIRDVQVALRDWCSALHVMPDLDPDEVLETIGLEVVREWFERQMFALDAKVQIVPIAEETAPKAVREKKPKMTKEAALAILEEPLQSVESDDPWP